MIADFTMIHKTELYEQEVIQWKHMQNTQYNTKSQALYHVNVFPFTGYKLSDDLRGR